MFSVLYRLLQRILGGFLLKKVIQMVKGVCRLPCDNFNWALQHQLSKVVTQVCCGRKWGVTNCCCPSNFRNSRAAPPSSLSLQTWSGISVRRGSLELLLKHCWVSSGFPEGVFNVHLTAERGATNPAWWVFHSHILFSGAELMGTVEIIGNSFACSR